uniref:NADH dehydrogenase subunit 9 n=1 Tax=Seculamonas ecuadoriensis TaxID=221724 RepID=M4QEG9_SECEC|nr:NADH dehydrogenase subunit 9 [Seculamonas ecuadoriensis]AGH24490.1 NADH dehydrogenase subunit 9 [Seculamonas ecuadoriensis]
MPSTNTIKYGQFLLQACPKYIDKISYAKDTLILHTSPRNLVNLMRLLRDDTNAQYKILIDICGVDYPERPNRFEVAYCLLSIRYNNRIIVKTEADEVTPVPSITKIFSNANWCEREVWDLFGVYFSDHPDLRRILTDYGFEGHPLRKDFPLSGYVEVRYDDEQKRVVTEPLELTQEFRYFDFTSPWEQIEIDSKK